MERTQPACWVYVNNWPLAFGQPAGFGTAFNSENDLHTRVLSVLPLSIHSHLNRAHDWKAHLVMNSTNKSAAKRTFFHVKNPEGTYINTHLQSRIMIFWVGPMSTFSKPRFSDSNREFWSKWLGILNSYVHLLHQTCEIHTKYFDRSDCWWITVITIPKYCHQIKII